MTQNTQNEQFKTIHPSLDFVAEHAYVGIRRNTITGLLNCLVRDDGRQIICTQPELHGLNIGLVPQKCFNYPKWSDQSITEFSRGTATTMETKQLFLQVKQLFKNFVEYPNEKLYDLLALWNIGTYYFPLFTSYPYIYMNGPTGSGKSKTLDLSKCICFNGQLSADMSPACIFRMVNANRCSLLLDELEHQLIGRMKNNQFRNMLLQGYKNDGFVQRALHNEDTGDYEPREYAIYSPKMLANIVGMDDALESRCITIHTQKSYNPTITRTAINIDDPIFQQIRDAQFVYMMRNWKTIKQVYAETSEVEGITGRDWELWRAPLALAKHFGGDNLFAQMKALALECVSESKLDNADSNENLLIETLLSIVKEDGFYKLSQIREEFVSHMEDSNWKPNGRYVGKLLRTLGFREKRRRNYGFEYLLKVEKIKQLAKDHGISVDGVSSEAPKEILSTKADKKGKPKHRIRELPNASQAMPAMEVTLGEQNVFDKITANWNPVKGCLHECTYCWAKTCADRLRKEGNPKYADGFKPALCEKELTKKFHRQFVFTVDMGDLFGEWVPAEWIEKVIEAIKLSPTSYFLFLTKNPKRYFEFYRRFPENIVLGVTIESNRDHSRVSKAPSYANRTLLRDIPWKHKLVSIEPILDFDDEALVNSIEAIKPTIVYIGYDNYNNNLPEPTVKKTKNLIEDLETFTTVKIQPTKRNYEMGLL